MSEHRALTQPAEWLHRRRAGDWSETVWLDRLSNAIGTRRCDSSQIAAALPSMLIALGWVGTGRSLAAYLPPPEMPLTLDLLRRVLSDLGFRANQITARGDAADTQRLRAGSLLMRGDRVAVYLGQPDGQDLWRTPAGDEDLIPIAGDLILAVDRDQNAFPVDEPRPRWFRSLFERVRDQLFALIAMSAFINVLGLALPAYTMVVYSVVIPSGAPNEVWGIAFFAMAVAVASWALRIGRQVVLSRIGRWAGTHIGGVTIRKMLAFPLDSTARMGVLNNVVRMRGFENARQFLAGVGGNYLIDYPFALIFVWAIAFTGGWLVLVPLISLSIYGALAIPTADYVASKATAAGLAAGKVEEHAGAALLGIDAFHNAGAGSQWLNRFADLAREAAARNRDYVIATARAQAIGQAIGSFTVLATLCTGVILVLDGLMHPGGLVAAMLLIWRIVVPAQQTFGSLVRLRQVHGSMNQVDQLMAAQAERSGVEISSPFGLRIAALTAERLYYRPTPDLEPVLNGVSFSIEAGQRVAVVGPNSGGKTALLECLAGLRRPQSGRVLINSRDVRQFDAIEYRAWIGYVPQVVPALPITVREYLRMRVPALSDEDAMEAFDQVLGPDWVGMSAFACMEGTLLDRQLDPFNDNYSERKLRYIVAFVAATLGKPAILLLDGAELDGDPFWDERIERYLDSLHGRTTVVWVPYSTEHIRGSDLMIIMENGQVRHVGPPMKPEVHEVEDAHQH